MELTKKTLLLLVLIMMSVLTASAQRNMDKLDRGLVAIQTTSGVYCSWRILGEEYYDVTYNLYRDGTKIADNLKVSNFTDAAGSANSKYTVKAVVRGTEQAASKEATVWNQNYLEITPDHGSLTSTYIPNDACMADVDGDGELEILMKFDNASWAGKSYPKAGFNGEYFIMEVYKLNGKKLWWIDWGPNMADFQNNEQNIVAYDWDGDGKAEAVLRASDGTKIHTASGQVITIGDASKNYLPATSSGQWFVCEDSEYLLYLNGETGEVYDQMKYPLRLYEDGETDYVKVWKPSTGKYDGGHRASKHFFGAPYLDGRKPSIFLARGIYTQHKMIALDVDPGTHKLSERWRWNCNDSSSPWYGQGYHNYGIADVDWDGRDEHHGDFNPYIHGHEIYACNEDRPDNNYRDATTSKIYYRQTSSIDDGRAMMGNFSNEYPGCLGRSGHDTAISSVTNAHIPVDIPFDVNFRIYWDGDLLEETFNGTGTKNSAGRIYKPGVGDITTLTGSLTNNDTKSTPCYQGDILGDWREEVIMRTADNKIRIYSTTIPTEWRNYTLWHDMQYRQAMVWQMCGYNQPPHVSYFLGELEGITMAPPALTMTGRVEIHNGETIDMSFFDKQVLMAETNDMTVNLGYGSIGALIDNAPSWVQGNDDNDQITTQYYTHTLTGTTTLSGNMRLIKQGDGILKLDDMTTHTYTGPTEIWAGKVIFGRGLENSHVWLNRFAKLETYPYSWSRFGNGIDANYESVISPGGKDGKAAISTTKLNLGFGSIVEFDLYSNETGPEATQDAIGTDILVIEKKEWQYGPKYNTPVFHFTAHTAEGQTVLPGGKYEIMQVNNQIDGNLSNIVIEGLDGQKCHLETETNNDGFTRVYLKVENMRAPQNITWMGYQSNVWDLATSENFMVNLTKEPSYFVTGDQVWFNSMSQQDDVVISEDVAPSKVVFGQFNNPFTLSGKGCIIGNANVTFTEGTMVTIQNVNKMTGGVTINDASAVTVNSLANDEGTEFGALGGIDNPITINSGSIIVTSSLTNSQPIFLGNEGAGVLSIKSGTMTQKGAIARNGANVEGILHKKGDGTLTLGTSNKFSKLYVDAGTVNISETSSSIMSGPETIVFNGQNTKVVDENNSYTYSKNNINYEVTGNATGKLYLDGRCEYNGTLKGTGSLTVYATYVRNNLNGNWSNFEGTLIANHSGNSYEFTWNNGYGLPKATLNIDGSTMFTCKNSTLTLGALDGSGTLAMTGSLIVGKANRDMNFSGTFNGSVNIFKEGTGTWTFKSAVNANEYTFRNGDAVLNNAKAATSLFGSATATVQNTASLKGVGTVGNVRVIEGGTLEPGDLTKTRHYGCINSTGFIYLYPSSKLNLNVYKALTNNNGRSYITVKGKLEIKGDINIGMGDEYEPQTGDEFIMWTCGSIDAAPTAINLPELPAGLEWDTTDLLNTTGILRVKAATGIQNVSANKSNNGKTYTLDGKIVENPTKKGIYIKNGKKVVIK